MQADGWLIGRVGLSYALMLACVLMPSQCAQAQDIGVVIGAQLEEGWEHVYICQVSTDATQKAARIPGGAMRQVVDRTTEIHLRVTNVEDDEIRVVARYESIKMRAQLPMPPVVLEFDTANPPLNDDDVENPLRALLLPLVGLEFEIIVDPSGEIIDIIIPATAKPVGRFGGLAFPFTDPDSLIEELRPIFTLGSGPEPLDVGETWAEESVRNLLDLGIEIRHDREATIVNVDAEGIADIELGGALEVIRKPGARLARAKAEESSVKGSARWDTIRHQLESFEEETLLKMVAERQPGQVYRLEGVTNLSLTHKE